MDGSALKGVITPLITPFRGSGIEPAVDYDSLDRLIEWQLASGVHGFCPCGTTGESATLSHEEKLEVIRFTVERVRGRVPVIAGTGSNCTKTTVEFSKEAARLGVDAALVVSPYYNKPTQEGLYQHYKAVAETAGLPIILYNIPGRTAVDLSVETFRRLVKLPQIIGIKESSGSADKLLDFAVSVDVAKFSIVAGDDGWTYFTLCSGGKGVISATANAFPEEMAAITDSYHAGQVDKSRDAQLKAAPIIRLMFSETNPGPVKAALLTKGKITSDGLRLPLVPVREDTRSAVGKLCQPR